jgi:hypothetical protein
VSSRWQYFLMCLGLKEHVLSAMQPRDWKQVVREKLAKLEAAPPKRSGRFIKNLEHLGELMGLGKAEREFLLFAILLEEYDDSKSIVTHLGALKLPQTRSVLASILGFKKGVMEDLISREGILLCVGVGAMGIARQLPPGRPLRTPQRAEPSAIEREP